MSIRKILMVGVAVLGLAGMVSAQLATNPGDDLLAGAGKSVSHDMTFTIEVMSYAEFELVSGGSLSGIGNAVGQINPGQASLTAGGNAGVLRVRTNYANWDLRVSAANSGRFLSQAGLWPSPTDPVLVIGGSVPANDTVTLSLGILLINPGNIGYFGPGSVAGAVNINGGTGAGTLGETGGASIANPLGTSGITGPRYMERLVAEIADNGLPSTEQPSTAASDGWVYIIVNAGLIASGTTTAIPPTISGNEDGTYTETVTFTMLASF